MIVFQNCAPALVCGAVAGKGDRPDGAVRNVKRLGKPCGLVGPGVPYVVYRTAQSRNVGLEHEIRAEHTLCGGGVDVLGLDGIACAVESSGGVAVYVYEGVHVEAMGVEEHNGQTQLPPGGVRLP